MQICLLSFRIFQMYTVMIKWSFWEFHVRKEVLASAVVAPGVGEPVGRQVVHFLCFEISVEHSKMESISQVTPQQAPGKQCPWTCFILFWSDFDIFDIIFTFDLFDIILENISCRLSVLDPVVFTQNDELGIDRNPLPHVICVICVLISDAFGHPTSMPKCNWASQKTSQPCRQITFFPWYEVVWRPVAERTKWCFICAISSNIRAADVWYLKATKSREYESDWICESEMIEIYCKLHRGSFPSDRFMESRVVVDLAPRKLLHDASKVRVSGRSEW